MERDLASQLMARNGKKEEVSLVGIERDELAFTNVLEEEPFARILACEPFWSAVSSRVHKDPQLPLHLFVAHLEHLP